ncbi:GTP-binding protein [Nocardia sp. NPDC049220]|uniref:ribosome hibernation factor-recruiting GTPase MRF n=1 Tax=Nocardia sp. NPDC049220 TaxID=3155273 RepID=UPI0033FEE4BB
MSAPDSTLFPPESDRRTSVVVLAGFVGLAADGVDRAAAALRETPGTVVVRHDLAQLREGIVHRTVRSATQHHSAVLELAHGCVSCTLRRDLLPLLCTLAQREDVGRIVLALDSAFEAEAVCQAIEHVVVTGVVGRLDGPAARDVRVSSILTCLDAAAWLADATGDETLAERGLAAADDDRTVAQIAVGQVEFTDAVIAVDSAGYGRTDRGKLAAVLARLAPGAPLVWVDDPRELTPACVEALLERVPAGSRRGRVFDAHAPLLRGRPPLTSEYGVELVEFAAARPFHPARLHEALDVLFDGVVTARGRIWLATQPDEVVWLESAGGGLRVGGAGRWLAAMSDDELAETDPERRAMAAMRWNERFGDRDVSLVILVHDADPAQIRAALDWALVEDEEMRLVERAPDRVAQWEDPFGEWHADPCDSDETAALAVEDGKSPRGEAK